MKISRNKRCPCGSGKKYKRCCIGQDNKSKLSLQKNSLKRFVEKQPRDVQTRMPDLEEEEKLSHRLLFLAQKAEDLTGIDSYKAAITLVSLAWNLDVFEEKSTESNPILESVENHFGSGEQLEKALEVIHFYRDLKKQYFPDDMRFVFDFELSESNGNLTLNVASQGSF